MKTAEEIFKLMEDECPFELRSMTTKPYIIEAMKLYAKQVAEQALKDASEKAEMIDSGTSNYDNYSIDKDSILNIEIKLP